MDEHRTLAAIERHLGQANELFARNVAAFNSVEVELRLSREERERTRESTDRLFADLTQFTHEISHRFERAVQGLERAVNGFSRKLDGIDRKIDHQIAESESHRDALMVIYDRLKGVGPPKPDTAA